MSIFTSLCIWPAYYAFGFSVLSYLTQMPVCVCVIGYVYVAVCVQFCVPLFQNCLIRDLFKLLPMFNKDMIQSIIDLFN